MQPNHDRTYWRAAPDRALIDAARYNPTIELCIALGERLDDLQEITDDAEDLRDRLDMMRRERDRLAAEVAEYEQGGD